MNEEFYQSLNETEQSICDLCGDFNWRDCIYLSVCNVNLNGNIVLIMGNHDRGRGIEFWHYVGFKEISKYPIIYNEFVVMSHEPPSYFNDATPYCYIYGHVHSTDSYKTITKNTACVSVER